MDGQTQLAIDQSYEAAHEEWKTAATQAVEHLARTRHEFTSEDVTAWINTHYPNVTTHEPRALGAVMRRAQTDGLIVSTNRFTTSRSPTSHTYPKRVWRSV